MPRPRGGETITRSLSGQITIEFGNRSQDMEQHPPGRVLVLTDWSSTTKSTPCLARSPTTSIRLPADRPVKLGNHECVA